MSEPPQTALIIDDDQDVCYLLVKALARGKIHAGTAHNLEQAIHCLKEINPSLILLDNNLPDGLGLSLMKHIREFYAHAKVIMITADTTRGLREQALDQGVAGFLPKPFELNTLLSVLNSQIQISGVHDSQEPDNINEKNED